jgi:putative RecB family exonuclease
MSLPLPTSLSPSKVAAFRDCALAFRYANIDRLPEPPSEPAAKGTLVHRALELLHCLPPEERTLEASLALLPQATDDVLGGDEYASLELVDRAAFLADAAELLRRYFTIEDPSGVQAIGLELRMEAEVGGVRLRGIIDRLELDGDGGLVVTDYKTGKVPSERFENGKLGGVHFYAFLCEAVLGVRPSRIQLLYLREPVMIIATPSDQSIRGLQKRVGAIWTAVERACEREDFRPNPGRLCDWCSFRSVCPAWAGQEVA